jgi:hypothetical protein
MRFRGNAWSPGLHPRGPPPVGQCARGLARGLRECVDEGCALMLFEVLAGQGAIPGQGSVNLVRAQ